MTNRFFAFFLVALLIPGGSAVLAEDILSVYRVAIENDPQFGAAKAEYQAVLESRNQSIAGYLPVISASANISQNNRKNFSTNTTNNYQTQGYNLSLTQPLYRQQNIIAIQQADSQVAEASARFEYARQNLIYRVAKQYFAVLSAENDLEYATAERKAIHEQLLQTQQRFNVGLISITDVHEAQARYDQAEARKILAENRLAISHEVLREITNGLYTIKNGQSSLDKLSVKLPLAKPDPVDINSWVKTAKKQNLLLLASQKAAEVAAKEVSRQRAGHFPSLDLVASHSYTKYGDGAPFYSASEINDNTVSLQLNVPLYQGGLVSSLTRAAEYRLQQAREKLEQQKRATEQQTRSAYLSVFSNISQVKALKQALASSKVALEATQAGFEVGTRTAVNVLDSQRDFYLARRNYARARYDYVLQTLNLKLAAGILSEDDLKQVNHWLK